MDGIYRCLIMSARNSEFLLKSGFKSSLIESISAEVNNNISNYYYFLGDITDRNDEEVLEEPLSSVEYEYKVRSNIIGMKKVSPSDVVPVIPKIEWNSGEVFDMYDSNIGYTYTVTGISTFGENTIYGSFDIERLEVGMLAYGVGITVGSRVVDFGVNFIEMSSPTSINVITEEFPTSSPGIVNFVVVSHSGASSLDEARFYCVSNDNVYKCIDNNGGSPSTGKPLLTISSSFRLEDGYVWKYMYAIPNPLKSKFFIGRYMPVITSLGSRIYTRGTIPSVTVASYGRDYPPATELFVMGDGHGSGNKYKISGINITNYGSGYTEIPEVIIESPLENRGFRVVQYQPNIEVDADNLVVYDDRLYQVMSFGVLGATAPTHEIKEPIYVGAVPLRFVGRTARATASVADGEISGIALSGGVGFISASGGSGYNDHTSYRITITDGNPEAFGASAFPVIQNGMVVAAVVANQGTGYTNPIVAIDPPYSHNLTIGNFNNVVVGDIIKVDSTSGDRFYQVVNKDAGYSIPDGLFLNHEEGSVTLFGVSYQFLGKTALASAEVYYGFGYYDIPEVSIAPPFPEYTDWEAGMSVVAGEIVRSDLRFYEAVVGGEILDKPSHQDGVIGIMRFVGEQATASVITTATRARMSSIVRNGQIIGVNIQDPGEGYTIASVVINGYPGVDARLTPNLYSGGLISNQSNIEINAVKGTIDSIVVKHSGSNIISIPPDAVRIVGDGSGATARAVFSRGGVSRVVVVNKGSGYTWARVEISYVSGIGTTPPLARAIISPVNGHGSDAVKELFAKRFMISTGIPLGLNQGFTSKNKYRQTGLIKNPLRYSMGLRATDTDLSSCYVVTSDFTLDEVPEDKVLIDGDGNRFIVVSPPLVESDKVSVLVASLSSTPIREGVILFVDGVPHRVFSVINPTVDKFSGELLFVDNRQAFLPTIDQVIMISSVISL